MKTSIAIILTLILAVTALGQVTFVAPEISVRSRSKVVVPIEANGTGLVAFQFDAVIDGPAATPITPPCTVAGTQAWMMAFDCNYVDGVLYVSAYSAFPIIADGTVLNIRFCTREAGKTTITLTKIQAWTYAGAVETGAKNGMIEVY